MDVLILRYEPLKPKMLITGIFIEIRDFDDAMLRGERLIISSAFRLGQSLLLNSEIRQIE